jgi:hypothetical protein
MPQEHSHQVGDNYSRHEIRGIGYCLARPANHLIAHGGYQQGEYDWRDKPNGYVEQHHYHSVSHCGREGVSQKLGPEILKAYPGASENAFDNIEILKRHNNSKHRKIMHQQEIKENRQEQEICRLVPFPIFSP